MEPLSPDTHRIVIGVDEAGYGPNIGPLVIAASAWSVPLPMDASASLASTLPAVFTPKSYRPGCQHIPLGDSKQLYTPGQGLQTLEAGLLACLTQMPTISPALSGGLEQLFESLLLSDPSEAELPKAVWYDRTGQTLPSAITVEEVSRLSQLAQQALSSSEIRMIAARALLVTESSFNRQLEHLGSKGRLLSTATMQVVRSLVEQFAEFPMEVFCDRQGGRKKYTAVLMEGLPGDWFDTLLETAPRSSYQRRRSPEMRLHFSVQGDQFPPTGLASMIAKYLRERSMAALNAYWRKQLPDLRPTAGYPVDAKRFRLAIEETANRLGHAVTDWWRVC